MTTATRPTPIRVGMDLDGVYYVFERAYFDTLVALGLICDADSVSSWRQRDESDPPLHRFREAGTWTFYEEYGHNSAQFVDYCNQGADLGIIFGPQPVPEAAKSSWSALRRGGCEIHVKTSRFFGSHPAVSAANTRAWLATEGLEYHSITFTDDKTAGPKVDLMLEDNVGNYDALNAAGVEVWLIDRGWNQDADHGGIERRRVYSHREFVTRVEAFADRRRVAQVAADREATRAALAAAEAAMTEEELAEDRRLDAICEGVVNAGRW